VNISTFAPGSRSPTRGAKSLESFDDLGPPIPVIAEISAPFAGSTIPNGYRWPTKCAGRCPAIRSASWAGFCMFFIDLLIAQAIAGSSADEKTPRRPSALLQSAAARSTAQNTRRDRGCDRREQRRKPFVKTTQSDSSRAGKSRAAADGPTTFASAHEELLGHDCKGFLRLFVRRAYSFSQAPTRLSVALNQTAAFLPR